eukprot:1338421-Amorphochlora_amoeboformis.AAC.1
MLRYVPSVWESSFTRTVSHLTPLALSKTNILKNLSVWRLFQLIEVLDINEKIERHESNHRARKRYKRSTTLTTTRQGHDRSTTETRQRYETLHVRDATHAQEMNRA